MKNTLKSDKRLTHAEAVFIKKKSPLPKNFEIYEWKKMGDDAFVYTGSQFFLNEEGKKELFGEKIKEIITTDEIKLEEKQYEKKTGNCADCYGTSKVFKRWHYKKGIIFKKCSKCNGTGKAKI